MQNTYKDAEHLLQDNINNYLQAATFSQADASKELLEQLQKYDFVGFLTMQIKKYGDHGTGEDIKLFLRNNTDTIAEFEKEIADLKQQITEGKKGVVRDFSIKRTDPSRRVFTSEGANV